MKLQLSKGYIDLPDGFSFDMKRTNAFFGNEGSCSSPVSIPATANNLEILDSPENTHSRSTYGRRFESNIQSGLFSEKCELVIDCVSKSGINGSLITHESVMYANLQDRKIAEVVGHEPILYSEPICSFEDMYNYNSGMLNSGLAGKFAIFPVAMDEKDGEVTFIGNDPAVGWDNIGNSSRSISINGEQYNVPARYGIMPFISLAYLVHTVFTSAGYVVDYNCFKEDSGFLSRIYVVHNVVDADVERVGTKSGTVSLCFLDDVVPDATVGDFINWLHDKFGAVVSVDADRVKIRLFSELFNGGVDDDLSEYVCGNPEFNYIDSKGLTIEFDTSLESAEPIAERLEDLASAYPNLSVVSDMQGAYSANMIGLVYVEKLHKYYHRASTGDTFKLMGSDVFKYIRTNGFDSEESIKPDDIFLPTVMVNGLYMPYIGKSARRYFADAGDKDRNSQTDIMICYLRTGFACSGSSYKDDVYNSGSGSLIPESMRSRYWKEFEYLLSNKCPEMKCTLVMPQGKMIGMDIFTPKIINGHKAFIKSLEYSLRDDEMVSAEAVLQLIQEYDNAYVPADIENYNGVFRWKYVNTRSIYPYNNGKDYIEILETDGLPDYTDEDMPKYVPSRTGLVAEKRGRWLYYRKHCVSGGHISDIWTTESYYEYYLSIWESQ